MYVDVYPIKRLPRRFGVFTYAIPKEVQESIQPGRFVWIPWRSQRLQAVVAAVRDERPEGVSRIRSFSALDDISISPEHVALYEKVARDTFQSVSSILFSAIPEKRKKGSAFTQSLPQTSVSTSIGREEVEWISQLPIITGTHVVMTTDLVQLSVLIRSTFSRTKGSVLVLLPHDHDIDVLTHLLANHLPLLAFTSVLTKPQRADLLAEWQSSSAPKVFLGTRMASLVPHPTLSAVIVGRSGVQEHAQYDRNPRYDAREVARELQAQHDCPLYLCDSTPRVRDLCTHDSLHIQPAAPAQVVNMNEQVRLTGDGLISDQVKQVVSECLESGKSALLLSNRKGVARLLSCKDCGFQEICGTCNRPLTVYESSLYCLSCQKSAPKPSACRRCKGVNLVLKSYGVRTLHTRLKELFPSATMTVCEKGSPAPDPSIQIVIATQFFYERYFSPTTYAFGAVILANTEQLYGQGAQTTEQAARTIQEYARLAERFHAPFIAQSWNTSTTRPIAENPVAVLKEEYQARMDYQEPPYVFEVHIDAPDRVIESLQQDWTIDEKRVNIAKTSQGLRIRSADFTTFEPLQTLDDDLVVRNTTFL